MSEHAWNARGFCEKCYVGKEGHLLVDCPDLRAKYEDDLRTRLSETERERDEARQFATDLSKKAGCWNHDKPDAWCPYCGHVGAIVARAENAEAKLAAAEERATNTARELQSALQNTYVAKCEAHGLREKLAAAEEEIKAWHRQSKDWEARLDREFKAADAARAELEASETDRVKTAKMWQEQYDRATDYRTQLSEAVGLLREVKRQADEDPYEVRLGDTYKDIRAFLSRVAPQPVCSDCNGEGQWEHPHNGDLKCCSSCRGTGCAPQTKGGE